MKKNFDLKERKKALILEKKRYDLSLEINEKELELLKKGYPIQKIIGFINFDNLKIKVNHHVLIPRYETEEVALAAYEKIKNIKNPKILDIGCGSGFIGLWLKQKIKDSFVLLTDIDNEAIKQTKENAKINNLKVQIIQSNLFEKIKGKFDLIISNPPYISKNEIINKNVINFEPMSSLYASLNGNYFYYKIISECNEYLKKNGWIFFEISKKNAPFLIENGFEIKNDINGKNRIALKKNN